jgi:hypothetical protein
VTESIGPRCARLIQIASSRPTSIPPSKGSCGSPHDDHAATAVQGWPRRSGSASRGCTERPGRHRLAASRQPVLT